MRWLSDTLSFKTREKHDPQELAQARKEEVEKGHASVFDSLPVEVKKSEQKKANKNERRIAKHEGGKVVKSERDGKKDGRKDGKKDGEKGGEKDEKMYEKKDGKKRKRELRMSLWMVHLKTRSQRRHSAGTRKTRMGTPRVKCGGLQSGLANGARDGVIVIRPLGVDLV